LSFVVFVVCFCCCCLLFVVVCYPGITTHCGCIFTAR
jgi:hypothetical protein